MDNQNERTLAYRKAHLIKREELSEVGGGSAHSTTGFTTKQTFDNFGNWDVGADVIW